MIKMMEKLELEKGQNLRTTPRARKALESLVFRLRQRDDVMFRGKRATKEAIVNASWLWLNDLPDDLLEPVFKRYLARLERILESAGTDDPGGFPGGMPPKPPAHPAEPPLIIDPPKRRKR